MFSKPIDPSERVVREPISNAEFCRFVQEAQDQRTRADSLEAKLAAAEVRTERAEARLAALVPYVVVVRDAGTNGGGWADWECRVCEATWSGAAGAEPQLVHTPDCVLSTVQEPAQ